MDLKIKLKSSIFSNAWVKRRARSIFYERHILCQDTLSRYFNIPKKVKRIDLILSDKKMPDSYSIIIKKLKVRDNWGDYKEYKVYVSGKRNGILLYNSLGETLEEKGLLNKKLYAAIEI